MSDFQVFAVFILVFVFLWCSIITDGSVVCSKKMSCIWWHLHT